MCAILIPTVLAAAIALARDWLQEQVKAKNQFLLNQFWVPWIHLVLDCAYYGCIGCTTAFSLPVAVPLAVPVVLVKKFHIITEMGIFWGNAFWLLLIRLLGALSTVILEQVVPDVWAAAQIVAKCVIFGWRLSQSVLLAMLYALTAVWIVLAQVLAILVGVSWTLLTKIIAAVSLPLRCVAHFINL